MRCHICDRPLTNLKKCKHTGKYEPCDPCIRASTEFDMQDGEIPLTDDDLSLLEDFEVSPSDIIK